MLRLRDRGATVFFSSHILGDAEAICSRVAILNGGRLVASGRVAEMVSVHTRGWELMVSNLPEALAAELVAEGATIVRHGDHATITLPATASPDAVLARVRAAGGGLVSLTAVRDSLEDVFLARVRESAGRKAS
jgi:ABC-2 type transport system ATP-binding protein